jgi:hypothetical protein
LLALTAHHWHTPVSESTGAGRPHASRYYATGQQSEWQRGVFCVSLTAIPLAGTSVGELAGPLRDRHPMDRALQLRSLVGAHRPPVRLGRMEGCRVKIGRRRMWKKTVVRKWLDGLEKAQR